MRLGELLGLRVRDVRLGTSGAAVHMVQTLRRDGSLERVMLGCRGAWSCWHRAR
jgi:hypothetical protein